jgi:hypothetical protein
VSGDIGFSEVGGLHDWVNANLLRRSARDAFAEVENRNRLAHPHDQWHVVLYEKNGQVGVGNETLEDPAQPFRFGGIQARTWLVEQEDSRVSTQCATQLDEATLAGRQLSGEAVRQRAETKQVDYLVYSAPTRLLAPAEPPSAVRGLPGGEEVLLDGHPPEQLKPLERPGDSSACATMGRPSADVGPVERHAAVEGWHEAGQHVEHRGLAGAIRADQAGDAARLHPDVDAVERLQTSEPNCDASGFQ